MNGQVTNSSNESELTHYSVKVILNNIDSTEYSFEKGHFSIWLPSNRKAKVIVTKNGFNVKWAIVDASFIPAIAHEKKQEILLNFKLDSGKTVDSKPFCTAKYKASINSFEIMNEKTAKDVTNADPVFPSPYDTFKGVKPNNLQLDISHPEQMVYIKKENSFYGLIQGMLYADMNFYIFNEHIETANKTLDQLSELNAGGWNNVKSFDSPEYGSIVMRTMNQEFARDTLFALGAWLETAIIITKSYSNTSKLIIHFKKLNYLLKYYKEAGLNESQHQLVLLFKSMMSDNTQMEMAYTNALKFRRILDLSKEQSFNNVVQQLDRIYLTVLQSL